MRLQTKLTLAFAAVALVPIAGLAAVARVVISNQSRGEYRRQLEDATAEVQREYGRLSSEVVSTVERVARRDDPTIGALLVELARGPLDDERRRELEAQADHERRALGLDVFLVLDGSGQLLLSPHFPGRAGDTDAAALAQARLDEPQLVDELVMQAGAAQPQLTVEAARTVQASFGAEHPRVIVIGGRLFGAPFLERLQTPERARLLDGNGRLIAGRREPRRWPRSTVELKRADGSRAAAVEVAVPDEDLRQTLELISLAAGGLGAGGIVVALLLGAFVARRIALPLAELAEGARAVSRGQLDVQVRARGSDEVGELGQAFNRMTADLQSARAELVRAERVAAWREIAQRIAHEIKNPLTPIQMAVETLQRAQAKDRLRDGEPKPQSPFEQLFAESAQTILDEVNRLKSIVAEFSSFARMPQPRLGACDLGEVVDGALKLYAGGAAPVERERDAAPLPVQADRDQLTQVLLNLLENARDAIAGRPDGRIRVRTRSSDGRVELDVEDNGPGLSAEAREKLFTPYFTTKAKGTGLGLAIVHRIVHDHGGEIRVESTNGARFTISLPRRVG